MFTGVIQAIGQIESIKASKNDVKLSINATNLGLADIKEGDSIAVDGVCLTATQINTTHFEAHVSKETLNVTTGLGSKKSVNLEKALRLNDRLGGHLVSGHVDGVGAVAKFEAVDDCWLLAINSPRNISKYIARKGSICVNGISLTVNTVDKDLFTVNIIPHTIKNTTLATIKIGDHVNLEIDQIARYVERMQEWASENT